ncbi:7526_t:CDS:2 [Scutellospora calospora]|uniref:7526_t:CDS:1 n=1 Tax=Scutellospora calospora TaxID=85575 RepID=A0ACA9KQL5_9GLOM|nr:7526_t:CDS:2 [Scutellospora calospora]
MSDSGPHSPVLSDDFSQPKEESGSPKSINGVSKKNENSGDEIDDLFGGVGSDEERGGIGSADITPIASPIASPINSDDEDRRLNFESETMSNVFRLPLKSWNNKYIIAKVPNFFHYTTAAFRPESYSPSDDQTVDDAIKLGAQDGLRWRYKKDPKTGKETEEKESNARIIKWNDGSRTLLIGKEQFEISTESLESKHQFLTVPHRGSNTLELHEKLNEHITFCPITGSITHKKLTIAIQSRHAKQVKTQFVDMNKDPKLIQLQIEAERDKKHSVQKRTVNANRVPKGRRKHDEDSDADERSSAFGTIKPRNDSYEDDSGFVVADEDEDDDFDKLKRRRKGKEKISDSHRKKTSSSNVSSKYKKHRHYDDESNEDDRDDSFQVDDDSFYDRRDRQERTKKRVKEHHYIEEIPKSRKNHRFEISDEENQGELQDRDEHSKKRVKEQQRIVDEDDEVNVVDQIASEPDEDEEEEIPMIIRRKRNRNVVVTDDDD